MPAIRPKGATAAIPAVQKAAPRPPAAPAKPVKQAIPPPQKTAPLRESIPDDDETRVMDRPLADLDAFFDAPPTQQQAAAQPTPRSLAPQSEDPPTQAWIDPREAFADPPTQARIERPDISFLDERPSESTAVMTNAPVRPGTVQMRAAPIPAAGMPPARGMPPPQGNPNEPFPPVRRQKNPTIPPPAARLRAETKAQPVPSLSALIDNPKRTARTSERPDNRPREAPVTRAPEPSFAGFVPPAAQTHRSPSGRPDRADSDVLRTINPANLPSFPPPPQGMQNVPSRPPPAHASSGFAPPPQTFEPPVPQTELLPPVARVAGFARPQSVPPPRNVRTIPPNRSVPPAAIVTTKTRIPSSLGLALFAAPLLFATAIVAVLAFSG